MSRKKKDHRAANIAKARSSRWSNTTEEERKATAQALNTARWGSDKPMVKVSVGLLPLPEWIANLLNAEPRGQKNATIRQALEQHYADKKPPEQ